MVCRVYVINHHAQLVILQSACNGCGSKSLHDALIVLGIDSLLQNVPGNCPVNSAGINVNKSQLPGEFSCDTALSRGRGSINGNYPMRLLLHRGKLARPKAAGQAASYLPQTRNV